MCELGVVKETGKRTYTTNTQTHTTTLHDTHTRAPDIELLAWLVLDVEAKTYTTAHDLMSSVG